MGELIHALKGYADEAASKSNDRSWMQDTLRIIDEASTKSKTAKADELPSDLSGYAYA